MPEEVSIDSAMLLIFDAAEKAFASGDKEAIAAALLLLDSAKRDLVEMYKKAEDLLLELMGDEPEYVYDGATLERKVGAPRKSWDHEALASIVADRIIDLATSMDDGEVTKSPKEIAIEMLRYAAPSYWRVTELKKIGVNADQHCEVGEPKTSIAIRKAQS